MPLATLLASPCSPAEYAYNRFSFPAPVYTYPLPTTASVHMLTAEELLDCPTWGQNVEPADKELLDMPIFDLNMVKLPPFIDVSAPSALTTTADFTATTAQINDSLKLRLDNIMTLAPVRTDESMPIHNGKPLPQPSPCITSCHHCPLTPALPVPQVAQPAPVILKGPYGRPPQPVSQQPPPATLLPPMAPIDVQTPQAPSTLGPALDHHDQPIQRSGCYEHSAKRKQNQQKEVDYQKSHKMHMTDEPRTRQTRPPSTLRTECGKMPSE
uniref:Uncharacterized protein n=1 Tax=Romanomermis culicivorax TaxID=13658 RepID=A0A915J2B5_ROMCU